MFHWFLPFLSFSLLSCLHCASSSCLLLKWFFFLCMSTGLPQVLRCLVRYFLHWLLTFILSFSSACLHPFILSSLLPTCFAFFLPFLPSFLVLCLFLPFLPIFLSFFCSLSPVSFRPFFVRVKPSYLASVWDALQHLLCGKPAWYAEIFRFFLLSCFFFCLLHAC